MRIYIDTSVVGGFYDEEFAESTKAFFDKVEKGDFVLVVSELLRAELLRAPKLSGNILTAIPRNS